MPAKRPHLAAAIASGTLGAAAAGVIVTMLDKVAVRATPERVAEAERVLVEQAPGLTLDQVRRLVERMEAFLDPDGVEPAEHRRRDDQELTIVERDGMFHVTGRLDAVSGAPVKTAIDGYVTARMRAARDDVGTGDPTERTSIPQLQAEGLIALAEHALGCDNNGLPLDGATVIVRMNLDTLTDGIGLGEIDGVTTPISPATARKAASAANVIPAVLGGESEILDWGRARRGFTKAQKLALTERDGGCAMCHLPPGMTNTHHIRWWERDTGPTDLDNGVLLCTSRHHRIHDNGWDITIDGTGTHAKVWFLPPATVDPARTPRLGSKARFHPGIAA